MPKRRRCHSILIKYIRAKKPQSEGATKRRSEGVKMFSKERGGEWLISEEQDKDKNPSSASRVTGESTSKRAKHMKRKAKIAREIDYLR